jgi:hypothetical protein
MRLVPGHHFNEPSASRDADSQTTTRRRFQSFSANTHSSWERSSCEFLTIGSGLGVSGRGVACAWTVGARSRDAPSHCDSFSREHGFARCGGIVVGPAATFAHGGLRLVERGTGASHCDWGWPASDDAGHSNSGSVQDHPHDARRRGPFQPGRGTLSLRHAYLLSHSSLGANYSQSTSSKPKMHCGRSVEPKCRTSWRTSAERWNDRAVAPSLLYPRQQRPARAERRWRSSNVTRCSYPCSPANGSSTEPGLRSHGAIGPPDRRTGDAF